ncbi:MAG: hypothetical protein ACI8WB_004127 [Phenylobacterium sp.]|jgi:hypothetical protein
MDSVIAVPPSVSLLIAMQFAAFGWRVNREISVGDRGEKTWVPVTDVLNVINFFLVTLFCVVIPIITNEFGLYSRAFLACGFTLMFFYPFNMLGHYELLTGKGRVEYAKPKEDAKTLDFTLLIYCPRQERVMVLFSFLVAIAVWLLVIFKSPM